MIVHVVIAGWYEDAEIRGIFSTKELAEKFAAEHLRHAEILSFTLDDDPYPPGLYWRVFLDGAGNVSRTQQDDDIGWPKVQPLSDGYVIHVWAATEEEASRAAQSILAECRK